MGEPDFWWPSLDAAVKAVDQAGELDRVAIRTVTVERFDRSAMVRQYEAVYRDVLT